MMRSTSSAGLRSPGNEGRLFAAKVPGSALPAGRLDSLSLIIRLLSAQAALCAEEGQGGESKRIKHIVAGHRNAEEREGGRIAPHQRGVEDGLGHLFRRLAGRADTDAGAGTLPPFVLDANMEEGDAGNHQQGQSGQTEQVAAPAGLAVLANGDDAQRNRRPIAITLQIAELAGRK